MQKEVNLVGLHIAMMRKELNDKRKSFKRSDARILQLEKQLEVARLMTVIIPGTGQTLLTWACATGNAEIVGDLLTNGADVDYGDDYYNWSARI